MDIGKMIAENGVMLVMACVFLWYTYQDKMRNQALLEEIKEIVKTLTVSNENIARSLDLLKSGCDELDNKANRNYEAIINQKGRKK